jgi:phosphate transport system protein
MENINNELNELNKKLLTMANHAETAVNLAIEALMKRNTELAHQVKTGDNIIDQLEIEVDDIAIRLLTKAPLASDLRFVTVAMKICQNLERVGDEATKIAKSAGRLSAEPPLNLDLDLPHMATMALDMIKTAIEAFVARDSVRARALIPRDKEVDALNKRINDDLTVHMMQHRDGIPRALSLMIASRSLERIADHAKNIAEEVVYLCDAEDIRHSGTRPV